LDDVAPLELPGTPHRREPAADVAERGDGPSDGEKLLLAPRIGPGAERLEDPPHVLAMDPFLVLDPANPLLLGRVADGIRVPAIGVRRRELAGVAVLEDLDELPARLRA